jgi:hypothetical protein
MPPANACADWIRRSGPGSRPSGMPHRTPIGVTRWPGAAPPLAARVRRAPRVRGPRRRIPAVRTTDHRGMPDRPPRSRRCRRGFGSVHRGAGNGPQNSRSRAARSAGCRRSSRNREPARRRKSVGAEPGRGAAAATGHRSAPASPRIHRSVDRRRSGPTRGRPIPPATRRVARAGRAGAPDWLRCHESWRGDSPISRRGARHPAVRLSR